MPRRSDEFRDRTRTSGLIASIVVNGLLLYAAHHVLDWQIGWITARWSDVLWAVDLTLETSIVVNALYLMVNARWFRSLGGAAK